MDPRLEGSLQMSCAFPLLRSEFKQVLISILDTAVKSGFPCPCLACRSQVTGKILLEG